MCSGAETSTAAAVGSVPSEKRPGSRASCGTMGNDDDGDDDDDEDDDDGGGCWASVSSV